MLFIDVVGEFLEEQQYKGNSKATITYYRDRLTWYHTFSQIETIEDFSERSIRRWLMSYTDVSRNTLANYDRAVRVFANWVYRRGFVSKHPMVDLPKPKEQKTQLVTFTADDIKAMLTTVQNHPNPLRDKALIITLLDTGIRRGEILSLKLNGIDWQEDSLFVTGKTGERVVPLGRKAKAAIRRYLDRERKAESSVEKHVFLSQEGLPIEGDHLTKHMIRIARDSKVKATKVGVHTFRHTFAAEFIKSGGDVFSLKTILGHTRLETTMKYVHLFSADLKAAHKKFAPADRFID